MIEAVNGLIKKWKLLDHTFSNNQIAFIGNYVRIVCALWNAFRPPRVLDTSNDSLKADIMLQKIEEINSLEILVKENNLALWKSNMGNNSRRLHY